VNFKVTQGLVKGYYS